VASINHALAQNNESIAVSNLKAGDSIYIITNREIDSTAEHLSYNNKVNENSRFTYLKVTLNRASEIVSQVLSYDDFMGQVCSKTSDWLLFLHGDSKTYKQSVQRGFDIQNTYDVNVIVFSWPSKVPDINGLKNLKNSERNVLKSVDHFNQLLAFMGDFKKRNEAFDERAKLSMLLHSLGNLYLENLVKVSTNERNYDTLFENIVMNSAAVNRKNHEDWLEKLNFQKRIYITNNINDFTLKGLHIFTKHGNQLGEKAKTPTAKNANYVQFSNAVGFRTPTSTTHTYFIGAIPNQSQNIRDFYFDIFHGRQIDFSDQSQFIINKKGVGYDIVF
jgi:esterase/lipase superfamily enzyme